ncbi:MAG: hypothetical protein JWM30_3747 [Burkholderia sp.]|jgi:hypothetical protein|nr:hypothetical protein [Burkholderia sp.]
MPPHKLDGMALNIQVAKATIWRSIYDPAITSTATTASSLGTKLNDIS